MQLSEEYIVGLTDGEGSFTAYVRNPSDDHKRIRRTLIEPRFFVKLIETDKIILSSLKQFFRCGNVYFQKDTRKNHRNCYRYEVARRADLEKIIIPFFKHHQLRFPSKRKDFMIFCKIMRSIARKKHLTERGLRELYKLKQTMH